MWRRYLIVIGSAAIIIAGIFWLELSDLALSPPNKTPYTQNHYDEYGPGWLITRIIGGVGEIIGWIAAHHDLVIALGTVAIASFTGTLWWATIGLRKLAKIQADEMQKLLTAARDNAAAAASQVKAIEAEERVMREQAATMAANLDLTKRAADAAQASAAAANSHAAAAEEANKINRDLLIATQRPWVSVDFPPEIRTPLAFDEKGARVTLRFAFKNVGRTPALYVWPYIRPILQGVDSHISIRGELREAVIRFPQPRTGFTIFPDQSHSIDLPITIGHEQIVKSAEYWKAHIIRPIIVGIVFYRFAFNAEYRETGFTYIITKIDATAILESDGDIPSDRLQIHPLSIMGGGFYAT